MPSTDSITYFVVKFIFLSLVACVPLLIDRHIVRRRDEVITWGRRAQSRLNIPRCLHVFTEAEPGMLDIHMRFAAETLFNAGLCFSIGLLVFVLEPAGRTRIWLCFLMMVFVPVSVILGEWLLLIFRRRRSEKKIVSCEKVNHAEGYPGVERMILQAARGSAYF
ncbi:hypothetical protein OQA88_5197 [Cercophora sp. LCS_1]